MSKRPRSAGGWAPADADSHDDYNELSPVVRRRTNRGSGTRIAGGQPSAGTAGGRVAMPERGVNRSVDRGEPTGEDEDNEADWQ